MEYFQTWHGGLVLTMHCLLQWLWQTASQFLRKGQCHLLQIVSSWWNRKTTILLSYVGFGLKTLSKPRIFRFSCLAKCKKVRGITALGNIFILHHDLWLVGAILFCTFWDGWQRLKKLNLCFVAHLLLGLFVFRCKVSAQAGLQSWQTWWWRRLPSLQAKPSSQARRSTWNARVKQDGVKPCQRSLYKMQTSFIFVHFLVSSANVCGLNLIESSKGTFVNWGSIATVHDHNHQSSRHPPLLTAHNRSFIRSTIPHHYWILSHRSIVL